MPHLSRLLQLEQSGTRRCSRTTWTRGWVNFTTIWRTRTRRCGGGGLGRRQAGSVDRVKAAICDNVNLYIEKNEEEFQRFLRRSCRTCGTLPTKTGLEPNKDHLATAAFDFSPPSPTRCITRSSRGGYPSPGVQSIVIQPSVREDDEELFESNWVEYVRDIEKRLGHARRGASIGSRLGGEISRGDDAVGERAVTALLGQHAADPVNSWKAKDAAVYLVISLTVKSQSVVKGATERRARLHHRFFPAANRVRARRCAANLRGGGVGRAVLHADALKFLTIFRGQIPKAMVLRSSPPSSRSSPQTPTWCTHRGKLPGATPHRPRTRPRGIRSARVGARYQSADLQAHVQSVLGNLFGVFALPDSQENEYAMRAVNRVVGFPASASNPRRRRAWNGSRRWRQDVQKPAQSHLLALPVRVHRAASPRERSALVGAFERHLFPPFQHVLQQDVVEFAPYVFQLLSQMSRYPGPLLPRTWPSSPRSSRDAGSGRERHPLVRLLEAYLRVAPAEVAGAATCRASWASSRSSRPVARRTTGFLHPQRVRGVPGPSRVGG